MYTVSRTKAEKFDNTYNYEIFQDDKIMYLSFEGNFDFYMSAFSRRDHLQKKICFTITKENYLEFLSSGGCNYPLEILKKVDVDMTTSKPIDEALSMFKEKLVMLNVL